MVAHAGEHLDDPVQRRRGRLAGDVHLGLRLGERLTLLDHLLERIGVAATRLGVGVDTRAVLGDGLDDGLLRVEVAALSLVDILGGSGDLAELVRQVAKLADGTGRLVGEVAVGVGHRADGDARSGCHLGELGGETGEGVTLSVEPSGRVAGRRDVPHDVGGALSGRDPLLHLLGVERDGVSRALRLDVEVCHGVDDGVELAGGDDPGVVQVQEVRDDRTHRGGDLVEAVAEPVQRLLI